VPFPTEPFLDAATFAIWAKNPAWTSDPVAASLLQVVSDWIRDRKPDIAPDDPAAQIVVFEVTREALTYGKYSGLSAFTEIVGHRQKSGTIRFREIERFIVARHYKMLGLNVSARPRGHFKKCDY
jgi:hypothetical protein